MHLRTAFPINQNLRGAALMAVGMFVFAINDTITKVFAGEINVGQLVLVRGLIATVLIYIVARRLGHMRPLSHALKPLILTRSVGEAVATFLFLTALFQLPIATVSAIMQMLPLAMTLCAALLLGEKVGWRRYSAVLIGLAGVLIIVRPGVEGFDHYSVFALGAVGACVLRDLATRQLHSETPALFVTFVTTAFVTLMGGLVCLVEPWQPMNGGHIAILGVSSLFLLTGYSFTVAAMRVGDIGFVSPFRYLVLVFSIFGGMMFYSEYPDSLTWLGSAIVVATGVYTIYRERVVRRQAITSTRVRF